MNNTILLVSLLVLSVIVIVLLIFVLVKISKKGDEDGTDDVLREIDSAHEDIDDLKADISRGKTELTSVVFESSAKTGQRINETFQSLSKSTEERLEQNQRVMNEALVEGLKSIQSTTAEKLAGMQKDISDKLDVSLNERLEQSFKTVSEQLTSLYRSMGELKSLEDGVSALNHTLTNVKTRGVYGEAQLGAILESILSPTQYQHNQITRKGGTETVEYAIRIPEKEAGNVTGNATGNGFIWLPIDSKFPSDIQERIIAASEAADATALKAAQQELRMRISGEACKIRDKYVEPPYTTDFGIMFLPTETLYHETLMIPGLVDDVRNKYKVIVSGPTTLAALVSSLNIGFRYLTVSRQTENVLHILGQFKTSFSKWLELLGKTQNKLDDVQSTIAALQERGAQTQKKLSKVESQEEDGFDTAFLLSEHGITKISVENDI